MAVQISGNDITVPRDGTFTRNVTIGGTLTYEDVTNIDSVGLITARNGIEIGARPGVAASISVDGNMIVSGISTFGGDVQVPDKIIHSGDTNTAIRFPAADTVTVETAGSEALRVDSSQRLLSGTTDIGYNQFADNLTLADSANCGITLRSGTSNQGNIYFSDGTGTSADTYRGYVTYAHADNNMQFATNAVERVRIDSSGNVDVKTGNLVIGTAGKGIDFSAQTATSASGASATSEVLDHYEEGTWTPTLTTSNGGAFSSSYCYGYYTRIGRMVHAHFVFNTYSDQHTDMLGSGSSSDGVTGGGLPFASANNSQEYYHGDIGFYALNFPGSLSLGTLNMYAYQGSNSSNFYFYLPNDNAASQLIQVTQFGQAYIRGCIHYLTSY